MSVTAFTCNIWSSSWLRSVWTQSSNICILLFKIYYIFIDFNRTKNLFVTNSSKFLHPSSVVYCSLIYCSQSNYVEMYFKNMQHIFLRRAHLVSLVHRILLDEIVRNNKKCKNAQDEYEMKWNSSKETVFCAQEFVVDILLNASSFVCLANIMRIKFCSAH